MKHKKQYNKVEVVCSCGIKIFGNSEKNAQANLKTHLKSKFHKRLISHKA